MRIAPRCFSSKLEIRAILLFSAVSKKAERLRMAAREGPATTGGATRIPRTSDSSATQAEERPRPTADSPSMRSILPTMGLSSRRRTAFLQADSSDLSASASPTAGETR
jgi:hypothetical protein